MDEDVYRAIKKGREWLEENLDLVGKASRPLEVSLVTLALHLLNSKKADKAFEELARNARQESE